MRKNKFYFLIFFIILFISIGFAYLSTTLGINGLANVRGNKWKIYFSNLQTLKGSDLVTESPVVTGEDTTEISYRVNLNAPGDVYKFNVDIVNDGTVDAMVKVVDDTQLSDEQKKYINYSITYYDEIPITKGNLLPHDDKDTLAVTVEYKKDIIEEELLNDSVSVEVQFHLSYQQVDSTAKARENGQLTVQYDWNYNFIKNGDFTDGLNGWNLTNPSTCVSATIDNERTYNGKPSVHIYDNGNAAYSGIISGDTSFIYRYPSGHSYYFKSCFYQDSNDSLGGVNQGIRAYVGLTTNGSTFTNIGIAVFNTSCKFKETTSHVFETLGQKKWTCYENLCSVPSYEGNENYVNRAFRIDSHSDRVSNNYWVADNQMRIVDSEKFNYDDALSKLPTPERDGYSFDGWYTDPYGGTKIDVGQHITESTTFYAHWNKI